MFQLLYLWNREVFYQNVERLSTEGYSSVDQTPIASEVFPPGTEM